jgi:methylated-DNA-protein-cysteine methyltransferase-like protein
LDKYAFVPLRQALQHSVLLSITKPVFDKIATETAGGKLAMKDDFYQRVYDVVRMIPVGKVTTYGTIAAYLGARSSSRLVGYALNAVVDDMSIPCHRVVNRNGELSGRVHFPTPSLMREMLESESVEFNGERVIMEQHFWDPAVADSNE